MSALPRHSSLSLSLYPLPPTPAASLLYYIPIHSSTILPTHLSTLVHLIVGQLDLLEGYDLLAQCLRADGTVGMRIDACRGRGIRLACHQPRAAMICIAIATRIQWNYVQQHSIAIRWLYLPQGARERDTHSGEHAPESRPKLGCYNLHEIYKNQKIKQKAAPKNRKETTTTKSCSC